MKQEIKSIDQEFKDWLKVSQEKVDTYYEQMGYLPLQKKELKVAGGRRYIKVSAVSLMQNQSGKYVINGESAWAFIDTTNGDILKPASWKAPAKHARGNIWDEHKGQGSVTYYGPVYLR